VTTQRTICITLSTISLNNNSNIQLFDLLSMLIFSLLPFAVTVKRNIALTSFLLYYPKIKVSIHFEAYGFDQHLYQDHLIFAEQKPIPLWTVLTCTNRP
jgi:hypothetical protein